MGPMGDTGSIGRIAIPQIGSKVFIMFHEDSVYNATYLGGAPNSKTIPSELLEGYPNSYGHIDAAGNLFFVNTQAKTMRVVHSSGTTIDIEESGGINIVSSDTIFVSGQSNIDILTANAVNIHGGSNIDIRASRIDLNKSTSGNQPAQVEPRPTPQSRKVNGNTEL